MMTRQAVKVEREKLETCMTCPLCNKLFKDATTVSECLHTFCRKCIYKKITEEEFNSCPVCKINLGCAPLEKLRADHNLEDLKTKLLPSKKRKKAKAPAVVPSLPEFVPSVPLPARRKEISLSSLVVSTPKVSPKPVLPRKRLKAIARKDPALRESILIEESVKKVEDLHESLSSPETLTKFIQTKRQNSSPNSYKQHKKDKDADESAEPFYKADLWKPLNSLVEAASKSKVNKSIPRDNPVQMQLLGAAVDKPDEILRDDDNHGKGSKAKDTEEHGNTSKASGNKNDPSPSSSVKNKMLQCRQQKGAAESEGLIIPAKADINTSSKGGGKFTPIWFSLVASNNQEGGAPLPQIASCYLRVKDGSLPVSTIKKYLVQKLGLTSEADVEITLQGKPVVSTLQLRNIVDWWLKMAPPSERIQSTVGSSAKEFVMVLSYSRKAQSK